MSTPDPVPSWFGIKYLFWMACRWVYFNPLTILLSAQAIALQVVSDYPSAKGLDTGISILGIFIAQVRNKGKDYTVPVAQSNLAQAAATLAKGPSPAGKSSA